MLKFLRQQLPFIDTCQPSYTYSFHIVSYENNPFRKTILKWNQ
jgi:hypothetical protein